MQPVLSLDPLFRPNAVAILGASNDIDRIGGIPVDYLRKSGFAGRIYPVNPNYEQVQGLPCYASLQALRDSIEHAVDLLVIAIPAKLVLAAVDEAAKAGVKAIVLFSSGFAEVDEAGKQAQEELARLARAAGMRVLGPNCLGLVSVRESMYATFSPIMRITKPTLGNIAIVSQSGAFGAYALNLASARGLGLSYWVTTGNEVDVQVADCITWLSDDTDTLVIMCYLEGCRDGDRLKAALVRARERGKRVVITKVGRTELGSAAAAAHTAALAGDDAVYEAMFRQYGAWRANSIEEFFTIGYAASLGRLPRGNRVGMVTVSGGVGALMADEASSKGFQTPELPAYAQAKLKSWVPFAGTRNPVDVTGQISNDASLLVRTLDLIGDSASYDIVPVFLSAGLAGGRAEETCQQLLEASARHPELLMVQIGICKAGVRQTLEQAGWLVFDDPSRALQACAALTFFATAIANKFVESHNSNKVSDLLLVGGTSNFEALEHLRSAGIPVASSPALARTARTDGVEMRLGVRRDPVFGLVIMCGFGGVLAKALNDTTVRIVPIDKSNAREMIDDLRGRSILAHSDVDSLVQSLLALSDFALTCGDQLDRVDVSPFVVLAQGEGAIALNASLVVR